MTDEQAPDRTDTPGESAGGPTLAPVRRRGESHLLALMLAAAAVFVAISIAKPWGEVAPQAPPSAATPSPAVELARSSAESAPPPAASAATPSLPAETPQRVFMVVQPGDVSIAVACTEDPGVSPPVIESLEPVIETAEPVIETVEPVIETAEPVIVLGYAPEGGVCSGASLQEVDWVVDWVVASPSAP
jgi:hypothetical protein